MKALLILMLCVSYGLAQKVVDYDAAYLFANTSHSDSVAAHADSGYQVLDCAENGTIFDTRLLEMSEGGVLQDGGGDITIFARIINQTGSVVDSLKLGVYRGPEYGYDWYDMASFSAAGRAKFSIPAQAWANEHFQGLVIRYKKAASHKSYLALRLRHFKWKS